MCTNLFRLVSVALLFPLLLCATYSLSRSQTGQEGTFSAGFQGTTNYRFAEPNELTIVVNLLGAVGRPGRYEISRSIDLVNLLSLAGGTTESANLDEVKIARTVKASAGTERKEIRVSISDITKVKEADLLLNHGDLIYVDRRTGITFQDVMSYLTTAAVLTTAYITIANQSKK